MRLFKLPVGPLSTTICGLGDDHQTHSLPSAKPDVAIRHVSEASSAVTTQAVDIDAFL